MTFVTYTPCADVSAADWIATSSTPWQRLVTMGPPGYPSYARLRFIPDPAFAGQAEHEALPSGDHPTDEDQLRFAVETLLPFTETPNVGYSLFWAGWGDGAFPTAVLQTPQVEIPETPQVEIPAREYYLCRVSLSDLASGAVHEVWEQDAAHPMPPPAFIWPEDRSWCVTQDVDPHWGGIGASDDAIDRLLTDSRLDIVRAEWDQESPSFY